MENFSQCVKAIGYRVLLLFLVFTSPSVLAFSLQNVAEQAKQLSKENYVAPKSHLPSMFKHLAFDDYQKIYFISDKTYWKKDHTLFTLQFYHQGMYFDTPVKINEIINNRVQEIQYSPDYFNLTALNQTEMANSHLGFAGFKIHYPINQRQKTDDEIFSALGASYFRVIGKGQVYGLSSRGLAIDTGAISGEEFPRFTEFWIEKPKPKQNYLVFYALLDSPRVTGAYKFILTPGQESKLNIESQLFFRSSIEKVGLAPLTSMYLYGHNQPSTIANYRPAIHDSNGLSILTQDNRWIWRPLNNPKKLAFSTFTLQDPKAFGLVQRSNGFEDFQDLTDHYEKRPTAWIEALNPLGKGHIELIEIPSPDETNDNIVAFWVPEQKINAGDELYLHYQIRYLSDEAARYPKNIARVKDTLYSLGDVRQANLVRQLDGSISYVIDFVGGELAKLSPQQGVKPYLSISDNGELVNSELIYNPIDKGWRLIIHFKNKEMNKATEIYASLLSNDGKDRLLTETWNAQYPAQ
jgi:periplasmic glucans biosynthesis protein